MDLGQARIRSALRPLTDSPTHAFGAVLVLLIISYWVSEAYGTERWLALFPILLTFLAIVGALGVIDPSRIPRHLLIMGFSALLAMVAGVIDSDGLMTVPLTVLLFYSFYGVAVILPYVLSRRTITAGVILGAICVYLMLGGVFATIYGFGAALDPGVFEPAIETRGGPVGYFSFMTLTTVGYGDIAPVAAWVRGVTVIEALTGQVFLVVLVARLVGMQIAQQPTAAEPANAGTGPVGAT